MNKKIFTSGLAALIVSIASAHAAVQPFEHAYTVGFAGSTTPVTVFDIDGPAPFLFLDLPATSFITSVSSDWFHDADLVAQFTVQESSAGGDKFWLSPPAEVWNVEKAVGDWHIHASYNLVGLICLENGGICVPQNVGSGSGVVDFTIAAVPEPEVYAMFGGGLALLGLASRRRRRQDAAA